MLFRSLEPDPARKNVNFRVCRKRLILQQGISISCCLGDDREMAGMEYEKIRRRLTTIFASRGCRVPEELADETIDRVSRRVADIQDSYSGNKVLYFLGVANNVHHEYLKRPLLPEPAPASMAGSEDQERTYGCLDRCIGKLTERSQYLISQY